MGADHAADDNGAARASTLDLLDAQADEPVVDQHVLPRRQHLADHGRRDRQIAVAGDLLGGDHYLLPAREQTGPLEVADPKLRPLEVGDEGERAPRVVGRIADQVGPGAVLVVGRMREVEARRVHPGVDERREPVSVAARRPDRGEDLRPPGIGRHQARVAMRVTPRLEFERRAIRRSKKDDDHQGGLT